ncbi:sodium/alanine symporter AgcS [Methanococcus maripaludis]|jgi:AGCS family alanine or glycine:cation symporter|uniref:Sodium/alanine symporter AgcS n=2 Tax=Methanococcus maripaludis TaxID=39152 RepID=AGCS_METMP|nr:sodium:alanine symporter family protein [Methanococcus maripaludis]Q6LX42.1 RecName: Full=Sodium/alanine symporter AgcS; AltName: Full=Alanine permease; AltName: Full=Alanine/glycine:cation symporter [Methanococcus maripaludis S2]6CSE_C Chain C, Sodium/alanine symporter AgcS [Methanococcus maripaludis S2]6CSE_M Chain M, Sodium/alanine symporter AgcS [Methanococcus maripaludis S2]6CSF_C Chain C, Sodium/alanine symporter AgcS [Methanococcus maripaludis S2]6CSF_M Chain M, Sodium/alanine sympor
MDFVSLVNTVNSFVWGPYMLVLLLGTGIFLTLRLGFMQIHTLPYALKLAFSKHQDETSEGDISHFQALMTALAATIGTGNIAGVATAYVLGGPGAIFWMWVTAFFGMATKYAEAVLAIKYRTVDDNGEMAGGPMYFLEKGLPDHGLGKILGVAFAFFGAFAAFGIGNMVQTNSVADAVASNFGVDPLITGFVLAIFTAAVILGGIKSIGKATGIIVPFMAVFYILAGLVILAMNIGYIIPAFGTIFSSAFNFSAGFGALIGTAIMWGVKRGVFSNEAGLGSAPIAAAAAKTDHPGRQALVSMTGTFLDTIVVCTITGLVLTIAGLKAFPGLTDLTGASLTAASFDALMPMGGLIVTIGLVFFAYSTVLGWSYYGEKCFEYLIGTKGIRLYRIAFVLVAFWGATASLPLVWNIADTLNGAMAIPNLIGLLLLSGVVVSETKAFNEIRKNEAKNA